LTIYIIKGSGQIKYIKAEKKGKIKLIKVKKASNKIVLKKSFFFIWSVHLTNFTVEYESKEAGYARCLLASILFFYKW